MNEVLHDQTGQQEIMCYRCPGCKTNHCLPVVQLAEEDSKWKWNGDMILPTFEPSVRYREFEGKAVKLVCHSYVTDGKIRFLDDCTHELRNQTVAMIPW